MVSIIEPSLFYNLFIDIVINLDYLLNYFFYITKIFFFNQFIFYYILKSLKVLGF
jgi:hypothetical protein